MKKKQLIILVALIVAIIGGSFGVIKIKSYIKLYQEHVSTLSITNVDLSKLGNGIYTGSYEIFPVAAEVKVIVGDHKILDVELIKHQHGRGETAEIIPDKVLEAQTLEVDVISGATFSSKIILKAIENALNSPNK